MYFKTFFIAAVLTFVFALGSPQAAVFDTAGLTKTIAGTGRDSSTLNYDAVTDIFTMEQTFTSGNQYVIGKPGDLGIDDIEGQFFLTANIADFGAFSGGSFSLVGTSTILGLITDEVLLSGSLDQFFDGSLDGPQNQLQFISNTFFINPLLNSILGTPDLLLVEHWAVGANGNNFTTSFGPDFPGTTGPDISGFVGPVSVVEPMSAALLGFGLVGLALLTKRGRVFEV